MAVSDRSLGNPVADVGICSDFRVALFGSARSEKLL